MMTFRAEWAEELKVFLKHNDNGEVCPAGIVYDTSKAYLAHSALQKKIKVKTLLEMESELSDLEQLHSSNTDAAILSQMRLAEQEIDRIYSEEVEKKIKFMKLRYSEGSPKAAK